MYRMAELDNLRTFVVAATTGSFTKAAERLQISPAMVGRRIQALEAEYALKLIERTTRTQRLTDAGTRFLERAARVVDSFEELADEASLGDEQLTGKVRISAPRTLGTKKLAALVAAFTAKNPDLNVELGLSDRNVDLVGEGYDIAVRVGRMKSSSLVARRIGTYKFVCCASPHYLAHSRTFSEPGDLRDAKCILNLNLTPRDQWPFETEAGTLMVNVHGNLELDNDEAMREAALVGAGVIYAPEELVQEDLVSGRLVALLQGVRTISMPIYAVLPSRQFVPRRVGAIVNLFGDALRDMTGTD
jgi:DNA-binding transcriptional LysR family regulator